jgi:hypothetical protein
LLDISQKLLSQATVLVESAYDEMGGAWPAAEAWLVQAKATMRQPFGRPPIGPWINMERAEVSRLVEAYGSMEAEDLLREALMVIESMFDSTTDLRVRALTAVRYQLYGE